MAFVRSSKYRHVFGTPSRKDGCYEGFRVTNCAFEGTYIAANKKFVAACVEVGGGGAFIVIPVERMGRLEVDFPKVSAHKEYILDMQFNPYNETMLATCSEDGSISIWEFPDKGILVNWEADKAVLKLEYHQKRCVQVAWHPIASNVLLSVSQEPKICVWNLDDGVAETEIDGDSTSDYFWSAAWSGKGDKIVSVSKNKKIRIYNARSGDLIKEASGHEGSKSQRAIFTCDDKFIFTTGFSRMSERQYACWDAETLEQFNVETLDTANGCLIPYYDADAKMVYIAAKGDSVIRYYELVDEEPYFHYLSTYQSPNAQRGLACIQRYAVNVNIAEVFKFYKLAVIKNSGYIEPVSFTVPRKSEIFQDDLYPDAIGTEAAQEASDWLEGEDKLPVRIEMKQFFQGKKKEKSGGLKKGGLKGLKAKKEAKPAAAKQESAAKQEPKKTPEPVKSKDPEPEEHVVKPSERLSKKTEEKKKPAAKSADASSVSNGAAGVDPKVAKELQAEVKSLKDNEKKMQSDIKSLQNKLQDYDKLTADIKLLCDAVKKNDERIATLEGLVQEESEDEES